MVDSALDGTVHYEIINGAPLEILWRDSATAQGEDGRAWLSANPVDALVLTERIPLAETMEWHGTLDYATRWTELALGTNPKVKPYLYETWDNIDDAATGSTQAWRDRIVSDLKVWQKVADEVNARVPQLETPMQIIPAGLGMVRLHDAIAEGKVPRATSIRDFYEDDIHPNLPGYYYVVMIHYATLTGQSPVGLPTRFMGKYGPFPPVDKDIAAVLQQLALETVQDFQQGKLP
ncbi:hypothetical protein GL286_08800 [Paracoccus aestuariivivens]|uniref:SGNH/GDSL hydrolase family protein n=2 Tax=Paracoccus aestuariivivens TaxID=1820333 RepID=A0A6L6J6X4_9RHOB|nr:hypothetical protein [Paracoccus aestuariivivens]